ncbi:MAG: ATP-binding protein [Oscillospiraceae bacterium]
MHIDKMAASFGRLKQASLSLGPGLNIIEAPNESGKSTWCAFLRTMLYGLSTRERGALADKNRYAPWDGSPMQGVLELTAQGRSLTITRDTARANAPMGRFSAVYTGTSEPVPGLTAANCGETLLGVPREVFERSAFIRQTGLAVDQDAELERRIAALLSTGEERVSFSQVYDALKAQLNRRRHNRTGLLPALEGELAALEEQLRQMDALEERLEEYRAEEERLRGREGALRQELRRHELADAAEDWARLQAAKREANEAVANAAALEEAARRDALPTEEALRQLAARAEALRLSAASEADAERRLQQAEEARLRADQALAAHPLAPLSPEEAAAKPLPTGPRPRLPLWAGCLSPVLGAALMGVIVYFSHQLLPAIGAGLGLTGALLLVTAAVTRRRLARWEAERTRLQAEREAELAAYTGLYQEAAEARQRQEQASAACAALAASRRETLHTLLGAVSLFDPAAKDLAAAESAVQSALSRRAAARQAEGLAREAKLRYDILQQSLPRREAPAEPAPRPDSDPGALRRELEELSAGLAEHSREASRTEGRLRALGDYGELRAKREALLEKRRTLQEEYDALALAMETLSDANAELQSRFSPELGRQAGRIFSALTGGKYAHVLLDRSLHAEAAERRGDVPRSVELLSRGCADQLYLALRLAICHLVLPEERGVPLILDDALVSFDDTRLQYALACLLEESRGRQILLFTCQSRERALLEGESGVTVLRSL